MWILRLKALIEIWSALIPRENEVYNFVARTDHSDLQIRRLRAVSRFSVVRRAKRETRKWPRAWLMARDGRGTALVSRVSRLHHSRARALLSLNLKKKRDCLQSSKFVWPIFLCMYISLGCPQCSDVIKQETLSAFVLMVFAAVLAIKNCFCRLISTTKLFYREQWSNMDQSYRRNESENRDKRTFLSFARFLR